MTACLMELMMSGSPSETATAMNVAHSAPLIRCFQISATAAIRTMGMKSLFPLKTGMSQSKHGLLNDWLTKRNTAASTDWSQAVNPPQGGEAAGKLKAESARGRPRRAEHWRGDGALHYSVPPRPGIRVATVPAAP